MVYPDTAMHFGYDRVFSVRTWSAVQWAIDHAAKRLFIISNSKLKPAIHIYEKFGFKEITLDHYEYERGNIAFERWI